MADALNVEPAVIIAAAAKPIAILRIMMLLHLLEDAPQPFRIKPQRLRLSCSVRQYRSVSRLRNPSPKDRSGDVRLAMWPRLHVDERNRAAIDRLRGIAVGELRVTIACG
jgi:hypothetical protein